MPVAELHLELDPLEEGRRRVEDDPVRAGIALCERADSSVAVATPRFRSATRFWKSASSAAYTGTSCVQ